MWGAEDEQRTILLNGRHFSVRRNLYSFLRPARKYKVQEWFFIDACCINQQNLTERNQPGVLNAEIYASVQHVLVWTGFEGSQLGKTLLPDLYSKQYRNIATVQTH